MLQLGLGLGPGDGLFLMAVFCLVRPIRLLRQVIFFIYFFNYDKHHEQYHVQIPNSI